MAVSGAHYSGRSISRGISDRGAQSRLHPSVWTSSRGTARPSAATELGLFSPLLLFALRPRTLKRKPVAVSVCLALWLASVWLISSSDPIRDSIVGFVLHEDTAYTTGFSEAAFQTITPGASDQDVRHLLGPPFGENWFYPPGNQPFQRAIATSASSLDGCRALRFEAGIVVERRLGSPRESCWRYSWSPREAHYKMRVVCFLNAKVDMVIRRWN